MLQMGPKAGLIFPFPGAINSVESQRGEEREREEEEETESSAAPPFDCLLGVCDSN